ncbi:MAG: hypothetical protein COB17_01070 [Sulfurimonas sp.]|nr:MAG: hypothetical protein COB17_01070 [Sulfurimonas sp.]
MNETRSIFSLDGITGMIIATVLLLSILAGLTAWGLNVQNANMNNFYEVKNEQSIKMYGSKIDEHIVTVGSK